MNNILITAKFIEKNGLKIALALSLFVALIAGLCFYFYAWQTMTKASDSTSAPTSVKQTLLETVIKDLDARSQRLNKLKSEPAHIRNIF